LVVDNHSSDPSLAQVVTNYPMVKTLALTANFGFAGGNNRGIEWGMNQGYQYLFLLNQDTEVSNNWLAPLLVAMDSEATIAAVQPKILLHPEIDKINSIGNIIHFLGFGYCQGNGVVDRPEEQALTEINYCSGAAVLLKTAVLKKIGIFDESMFMYSEDLDLGWRLWLTGFKSIYCPSSTIYHKYKFSKSVSKIYFMERNRIICLLKNYQTKTLLYLLPALLLMEIGQMFYTIKRKWFWQKIKSYYYFTDPQVWLRIYQQRKNLQKIRQVSDGQILRKFSGRISFQEIDNPLLIYIANPIFHYYLSKLRKIIP